MPIKIKSECLKKDDKRIFLQFFHLTGALLLWDLERNFSCWGARDWKRWYSSPPSFVKASSWILRIRKQNQEFAILTNLKMWKFKAKIIKMKISISSYIVFLFQNICDFILTMKFKRLKSSWWMVFCRHHWLNQPSLLYRKKLFLFLKNSSCLLLSAVSRKTPGHWGCSGIFHDLC